MELAQRHARRQDARGRARLARRRPRHQGNAVDLPERLPRRRSRDRSRDRRGARSCATPAINDFGTIVNPMIVDGQLHGGVAQGIGQALMEEVSYDESGQPITGSFMDYAMPRAEDIPLMAIGDHPSPAKSNPLGTKGCGEAGCAGSLCLHRQCGAGRAVRVRRHADRHAVDAGTGLARDPGCAEGEDGANGPGSRPVQAAIIDDLRAAFDATTVLTGSRHRRALSHRHVRRPRPAAACGDAAAHDRGRLAIPERCATGRASRSRPRAA